MPSQGNPVHPDSSQTPLLRNRLFSPHCSFPARHITFSEERVKCSTFRLQIEENMTCTVLVFPGNRRCRLDWNIAPKNSAPEKTVRLVCELKPPRLALLERRTRPEKSLTFPQLRGRVASIRKSNFSSTSKKASVQSDNLTFTKLPVKHISTGYSFVPISSEELVFPLEAPTFL